MNSNDISIIDHDGPFLTVTNTTTDIWAVAGSNSRIVLAITEGRGVVVATKKEGRVRTVVGGAGLHMSPGTWRVGEGASLLMPFGEGIDIWELGTIETIELLT